jgi:small-conductance mechanosensitive channel
MSMLGDIFRDHLAEVLWMAAAGAIVIVAVWVLRRVILQTRSSHPHLAPILLRTQNALIALLVVAAVRIVMLGTDSSDERWVEILAHIMSIAFIIAVVWAICEVLIAVEGVLLSRHAIYYAGDGVRVRKVNTQVTMLRRLLVAIVITVGIGAVLMTFPAVRVMGQGLLASAGLISIIAGLAAQTTLSNVFAGIQLALTDSIRVGDVVSAENESGTVGEITLTYVVLYLWDDRRLILPSSYFTTTPFENWTRWGDRINSVVLIEVDWSVPLDDLRAEYTRAVEESPLWDKRDASMAVADIAQGSVQLRFSTSAATTSDMFGLNALVRETVVRFLSSRGVGVPRTRTEWLANSPGDPMPQ